MCFIIFSPIFNLQWQFWFEIISDFVINVGLKYLWGQKVWSEFEKYYFARSVVSSYHNCKSWPKSLWEGTNRFFSLSSLMTHIKVESQQCSETMATGEGLMWLWSFAKVLITWILAWSGDPTNTWKWYCWGPFVVSRNFNNALVAITVGSPFFLPIISFYTFLASFLWLYIIPKYQTADDQSVEMTGYQIKEISKDHQVQWRSDLERSKQVAHLAPL